MKPHTDGPVRVFVVDDLPVVRRGIVEIITAEPDLEVCGETGDPDTALVSMGVCNPDLTIVELSLAGGGGLQLIREITRQSPHVAVLVFSTLDEEVFTERALKAGARGFISKRDETAAVVAAIRKVAAGDVGLSAATSGRLLQKWVRHPLPGPRFPHELLSDRQLEVFELIGMGLSTGEIARHLHLSTKTIESHCQQIKQKLGISDRGALRRTAIEWAHRRV